MPGGGGTVVEYLDVDGSPRQCNDYKKVVADLGYNGTTWNTGWYVVEGELECKERIVVSGDVYLILTDGSKLTANYGIQVTEGNSLTIYGQDVGSGTLEAMGVSTYAAIGGGGSKNASNTCGSITINGGVITADFYSGAGVGAGIGGGALGSGGTITINNGVVNATGINGAAIGGGGASYNSGLAGGSSGKIVINGGTVTATAKSTGAAIGSGGSSSYPNVDSGSITITGGTVVAETNGQGAAIGSGQNTSGSTIIISGGDVTATSNSSQYSPSAIGNGHSGTESKITISGGVINATANANKGSSAAIGGGNDEIVISGGEIIATSKGNGAAIGGSDISSCGSITISGGMVSATGNKTAIGDGALYNRNKVPGVITIAPTSSTSLEVKTGTSEADATEINGSPFTTETNIQSDVKGKLYFHSETGTAPHTITVTVADQTSSTAAAYAGSSLVTQAKQGTEITLQAKPAAGYHFVEWTVISGGVKINNNTFTMPDEDVKIQAKFAEHTWQYTADGANLTAKCEATGCECNSGVTLTLSAPSELLADGSAKAATLSDTDAWKQAGLNVPTIFYSTKLDNGDWTQPTNEAPTDAGTYQAMLMIEDAEVTAAVEFTVKQSDRTIEPPTQKGDAAPTVITLNDAQLSAGVEDGKVEYGWSRENDSTTVENWQESPVFTGLTANTTYYFFARVTGGKNYGDAVSKGTELKTAEPSENAITIAEIGEKTYGGSEFELSLANPGSGTGKVTFESSAPAILSIDGTTATIHKAGEVTITAKKASDGTYSEAETSVTLTINKRRLTIKAVDKQMESGGEWPILTYHCEGFADGDEFTEEPSLTLEERPDGGYDIVVSGGAWTNQECYDVTYVIGKLTISEKALYTVTVENGSGSGQYSRGDTVSVTAEPRSGYVFVSWSSDNDAVIFADAKQSATTFEMPAENVTVTAQFELVAEEPDAKPSQTISDDGAALLGATVVIAGGAAALAYHYREALPIWKLSGVVELADKTAEASTTPVANATVELSQNGEVVKTLTTDENGFFATRVPKGTYEATVTWEDKGVVYTISKELTAESVLEHGDIVQRLTLVAE